PSGPVSSSSVCSALPTAPARATGSAGSAVWSGHTPRGTPVNARPIVVGCPFRRAPIVVSLSPAARQARARSRSAAVKPLGRPRGRVSAADPSRLARPGHADVLLGDPEQRSNQPVRETQRRQRDRRDVAQPRIIGRIVEQPPGPDRNQDPPIDLEALQVAGLRHTPQHGLYRNGDPHHPNLSSFNRLCRDTPGREHPKTATQLSTIPQTPTQRKTAGHSPTEPLPEEV